MSDARQDPPPSPPNPSDGGDPAQQPQPDAPPRDTPEPSAVPPAGPPTSPPEQPPADPISERRSIGADAPRRLRPWYFVVAMCLTWIVGVFGAKLAYDHISFLHGSTELVDAIQRADTDRHADRQQPMDRLPAVMEKATLAAMATHHQRAFPLSVAQLLLCAALALVSLMALTGRKGARSYAIQVIGANALLALVAFVVMAPVRDAVAQAVALDMVEHGPAMLPDLGRAESLDAVKNVYRWTERLRLGMLEVGVYGGAILALTRERTKRYFGAVEAALAKAEQSDSRE